MATITWLFFLDLPCKHISLNAIVSFGLHINGIIWYAVYILFRVRQVESEVRCRCWPSHAGPSGLPSPRPLCELVAPGSRLGAVSYRAPEPSPRPPTGQAQDLRQW